MLPPTYTTVHLQILPSAALLLLPANRAAGGGEGLLALVLLLLVRRRPEALAGLHPADLQQEEEQAAAG